MSLFLWIGIKLPQKVIVQSSEFPMIVIYLAEEENHQSCCLKLTVACKWFVSISFKMK